MNITEKRRSLDMSLGEAARTCGIKTSELSSIEWGRLVPTDGQIMAIAGALQMTPGEVKEGLPSPEEATNSARKFSDVIEAMFAAQADATKCGFRKGHGGQSSLQCPICKRGTLNYSVASYNGHMWGKCSTDGCVGWMQ